MWYRAIGAAILGVVFVAQTSAATDFSCYGKVLFVMPGAQDIQHYLESTVQFDPGCACQTGIVVMAPSDVNYKLAYTSLVAGLLANKQGETS